jgi:hypothetical protein
VGKLSEQVQADLTKANAIEFVVRDEPWIKYKVEDGTALFGRIIIPKIFRSDEYDPNGQPIYAWSSQLLFTTICPRSLRGTPTNPPPTTLDPSKTRTTSVDFERVGPEKWNLYEFSDGTTLRVKLELTSIHRTDKYGPDGDPLYVINHQPITRLKVPEKLFNRQPIIKKDARPGGPYG